MIIFKHENDGLKELENLIAVNIELTAHTATKNGMHVVSV